jgi:hypothetical protein
MQLLGRGGDGLHVDRGFLGRRGDDRGLPAGFAGRRRHQRGGFGQAAGLRRQAVDMRGDLPPELIRQARQLRVEAGLVLLDVDRDREVHVQHDDLVQRPQQFGRLGGGGHRVQPAGVVQ